MPSASIREEWSLTLYDVSLWLCPPRGATTGRAPNRKTANGNATYHFSTSSQRAHLNWRPRAHAPLHVFSALPCLQ